MLAAAKGQFNDLVAKFTAGDALAEETLVACGRAGFGLAPIDQRTGTGTTDAVVLDALTAFTVWLKGKAERAQNPPNSAPCTDCPAATE